MGENSRVLSCSCSLQAPAAPKHYSADTIEDKVQPIDRIFVSIAAHHDSLAPELRLRKGCKWHLFLSHIWSSSAER